MGELSEDGPDDWESLDASAAHIANLLAAEPADGNLGAKPLNYLKMINLLGFIFSLISCNSSWLNPAQVLKKLFPNGKKPSL